MAVVVQDRPHKPLLGPVAILTITLWLLAMVSYNALRVLLRENELLHQAAYDLFGAIFGILLCVAADWILRRLYPRGERFWVVIASATALVMALLWSSFDLLIGHLDDGDLMRLTPRQTARELLNYLTQPSWIFIAWICGWTAINYERESTRRDLALARAELSAADDRHQMLRYQLNPQFLFQTLDGLSSLVRDHDRTRAESMVSSLAKFLRVSLAHTPQEKVTVRLELEAEGQYLLVEQIRRKGNLAFTTSVSPRARRCLAPSLILQPLIEGAIAASANSVDRPIAIGLDATVEAGRLRLSVTDGGAAAADHGACETVRRRLALLYGALATVTARTRPGGGFESVVVLPEEYA